MRIPTITSTPATCQNTLMLFINATSGDEKMLINACNVRMIANSKNVSVSMCEVSPQSAKPRFNPNNMNVAFRNVAHP